MCIKLLSLSWGWKKGLRWEVWRECLVGCLFSLRLSIPDAKTSPHLPDCSALPLPSPLFPTAFSRSPIGNGLAQLPGTCLSCPSDFQFCSCAPVEMLRRGTSPYPYSLRSHSQGAGRSLPSHPSGPETSTQVNQRAGAQSANVTVTARGTRNRHASCKLCRKASSP